MKQSIRLIPLFLILVNFAMSACGNKTATVNKEITPSEEQQNKSENNSSNLPEQAQPMTAVFEFVSYNDNGDYMLLTAKK